MKIVLATIALGATIISNGALAQESGAIPQESVAAPQARGVPPQKEMTRQQAQQRAEKMFLRFDLNHDGVVTRQEAEQAAAQSRGKGQRMLDRAFGSSQSLTLQQFEAAALARFDARDVNHDGLVTATERHKGRDQLKTQRHAPGEQQQTPETAPPPPGQ